MTYTPTVQIVSHRLLIYIFAMDPELKMFIRDVSQAYVQADTDIQWTIFVTPHPIVGITSGMLLRINRPLYGIPKARTNWFLNYHKHHTKNLGMCSATHDSCSMFIKVIMNETIPCETSTDINRLHTDNTLNAGKKDFVEREKE